MEKMSEFFGKLHGIFEGRQLTESIEKLAGTAIGTWDAANFVQTVGRKKVSELKEKIEYGNFPEKNEIALKLVVSSFEAALTDFEKALQNYDMAWEDALAKWGAAFSKMGRR